MLRNTMINLIRCTHIATGSSRVVKYKYSSFFRLNIFGWLENEECNLYELDFLPTTLLNSCHTFNRDINLKFLIQQHWFLYVVIIFIVFFKFMSSVSLKILMCYHSFELTKNNPRNLLERVIRANNLSSVN